MKRFVQIMDIISLAGSALAASFGIAAMNTSGKVDAWLFTTIALALVVVYIEKIIYGEK